MTLDELREHFDLLDGWEDRYRYLIDLGKQLPPMPAELKNEATRVHGCLSQVWLVGRHEPDGLMHFLADSDAAIVRGLIAILLVAYDHRSAADVAATDARSLFDELGFGSHVSMNRRNGFFAMVGRIQAEAQAALAGPELVSPPSNG